MAVLNLVVDPKAIRVKHLRQLGRIKNFDDLAQWFIQHAGANEAELDELTLSELTELQQKFFEQLRDSAVPKANGASS